MSAVTGWLLLALLAVMGALVVRDIRDRRGPS